MAVKIYTKQYAGVLGDVFEVEQHFLNTFGGALQVVDGISNRDKFIDLKISDTDVVIQDYSTDENVAFGTGTGNTNRFGPRREIKSVDVQVDYEAPLAIHEGVDDMTVNDNADQVIEERTVLHAQEWTEQLNGILSKVLSENASQTLTGEITDAGVRKAFADAAKAFLNNKVAKNIGKTAYVNADVYNVLMDSGLTTTGKNSSVNIDNNTLPRFKGFDIVVLADEYFQEGENIIFAADNVGVAGVGIQVYRIMDSEDFAGVTIQSAAKFGKYVPEKNKVAIIKATLTEAAPAGV